MGNTKNKKNQILNSAADFVTKNKIIKVHKSEKTIKLNTKAKRLKKVHLLKKFLANLKLI